MQHRSNTLRQPPSIFRIKKISRNHLQTDHTTPHLTNTYKEKMETEWAKGDEGLFSYYCALAQVCNTLAQYEGFSLSRDIFSLLYPSFHMFEEQLNSAMSKRKEPSSADIEEPFKDSVCEFINAVNSVVYHTVHTDQVFLVIPAIAALHGFNPGKAVPHLFMGHQKRNRHT